MQVIQLERIFFQLPNLPKGIKIFSKLQRFVNNIEYNPEDYEVVHSRLKFTFLY